MNVLTVEGIVEGNKIVLVDALELPDNTRVLVVVPGVPAVQKAQVLPPRLRHREQAVDFDLQVEEEHTH